MPTPRERITPSQCRYIIAFLDKLDRDRSRTSFTSLAPYIIDLIKNNGGKVYAKSTIQNFISAVRGSEFNTQILTTVAVVPILTALGTSLDDLAKQYAGTLFSTGPIDDVVNIKIKTHSDASDEALERVRARGGDADFRYTGAIVKLREMMTKSAGVDSGRVRLTRINKTFFPPDQLKASIEISRQNFTKYMLSSLPTSDLTDDVLTGNVVELQLMQVNYHDVLRCDPNIFDLGSNSEIARANRLQYGNLDPQQSHVPYNLTAIFIVRFADGWIFGFKRGRSVAYYPDTIDISGGEQLREDDFTVNPNETFSRWLKRAVYEEVFPLAPFGWARTDIEKIRSDFDRREMFKSIELLGIGYCSFDCSFPIFTFVQLNWTHNEYIRHISDIQETSGSAKFQGDREGLRFVFHEEEVITLINTGMAFGYSIYLQQPQKSEKIELLFDEVRMHPMTPIRLEYLIRHQGLLSRA